MKVLGKRVISVSDGESHGLPQRREPLEHAKPSQGDSEFGQRGRGGDATDPVKLVVSHVEHDGVGAAAEGSPYDVHERRAAQSDDARVEYLHPARRQLPVQEEFEVPGKRRSEGYGNPCTEDSPITTTRNVFPGFGNSKARGSGPRRSMEL